MNRAIKCTWCAAKATCEERNGDRWRPVCADCCHASTETRPPRCRCCFCHRELRTRRTKLARLCTDHLTPGMARSWRSHGRAIRQHERELRAA